MQQKRQSGFTLMEMVITITIVGLLAGVSGSLLTGGFRAYESNSQAVQLLANLRYAMERVTREVMSMQAITGGYDITTMSANRLQFTKGDGVAVDIIINPPLMSLTYSSVPGVIPTLVDSVQAASFSYFQMDGLTPALNANEISFVQIEINLKRNQVAYTQRTRVAMRARQ
ncbi:MAG: type II secretion system GspH family protein [Gammaproteobacteria bacterium]|nr:type II secretion system GspH family protein [Gammaproteobacteria bacterium]MDH5728273.1 type II secretion system GspH family protein [Gammaproteobacteria bacterium]